MDGLEEKSKSVMGMMVMMMTMTMTTTMVMMMAINMITILLFSHALIFLKYSLRSQKGLNKAPRWTKK